MPTADPARSGRRSLRQCGRRAGDDQLHEQPGDNPPSECVPGITNSVTLNGGTGNAVSGSGANRIFFVNAPNGTVAINSLSLMNGRAEGGNGGSNGGGGGAGLGGALFVNAGSVTVTGVNFAGNTAVGGNGGGDLPNFELVDEWGWRRRPGGQRRQWRLEYPSRKVVVGAAGAAAECMAMAATAATD